MARADALTREIEHGTQLPEVVACGDDGDELFFAVGPGPVDLDLSLFDDIDEVASVALFEHDLARR